jgi:hypothetical protein
VSFLPIVQRELATAARKLAIYRARMGFVVLTSAFAALLLLIADSGPSRQVGNTLFPTLTVVAFLYCLLAGARQSADCLSEEKREGTLGLMFLTDLRGHDVVFGKFVSVSIRTFQGLIAILPVLAIGLLLGGITGGEFWRTAAVLVNTLFFAVALGLGVSSISRQAHVALGLTGLALTLLLLVPLGADWALRQLWTSHGLISWASPAAAGLLASDVPYRLAPDRFWSALLGNHLLGWCFLIGASVALPRAWQERAAQTGPSQRLRAPRATARRAALRQRLLDINPICWLAARNERERILLHAFVPVVLICGVGVFLLSEFLGGYTLGAASVLNLAVVLVLKLWVAWHGCSTLAEAKRTGAIELLLATPLTVEEIIRGHWQGLQRFFMWPAVAALAVPVFPAVQSLLSSSPPLTGVFFLPIPALTIFGLATSLLDLIALGWVGMWMGLSQPKTVQAFGKTVFLVVIIPTVVFCLPNILFDLFWISWARRKLEHGFRQAAAERTTPALDRIQQTTFLPRPATLPPVIRA